MTLQDLLANGTVTARGCIEWNRSRDGFGYGILTIQGKTARAHIVAWTLTNGPLAKGECVLHECDNPPCFNSAHLFKGTKTSNNADRNAKGRQARGETHSRCILSAEQVISIRKSTDTHAALGRLYGVHENTIQAIRYRKSWTHI